MIAALFKTLLIAWITLFATMSYATSCIQVGLTLANKTNNTYEVVREDPSSGKWIGSRSKKVDSKSWFNASGASSGVATGFVSNIKFYKKDRLACAIKLSFPYEDSFTKEGTFKYILGSECAKSGFKVVDVKSGMRCEATPNHTRKGVPALIALEIPAK